MPRFACRTDWQLAPSGFSGAVAIARAAGRARFDLTVSNPTAVGLDLPSAEIGRALGRAGSASYRPDPLGLESAREAVAAELGVDAARVVLTASTSEAHVQLLRLLVDPGEAMLVPTPGYPLFGWLADLCDVELDFYRLERALDFRVDRADLAARMSARHRILVAVSPDNPTGTPLARDDLDLLLGRCAADGASFVLDEVFRDYVRGTHPHRADLRSACIPDGVVAFSLGGLSKSLAQPGLKLAWMVLHGREQEVEEVLERLEVLLDTTLSVSMPVQVALPELLALGPEIRAIVRARIERNLASLEVLQGSPVSALPVRGGWSVVLEVPRTRSDEDWALELLERDGVVLHPGRLFGFPETGWLVLSLLPGPEDFAAAIERIAARISGDASCAGGPR